MPIPTDEQIGELERRWLLFPELAKKALEMLSGEYIPNDKNHTKRINERIERVLDLLRQDKYRDYFEFSFKEDERSAVKLHPSLDLRGIRVRNLELQNFTAPGVHFEGSYFYNMDLKYSYIEDAHFERSEIEKVNLEKSQIGGIHLEHAILGDVCFRFSEFSSAHIEGTNFFYCKFDGSGFHDPFMTSLTKQEKEIIKDSDYFFLTNNITSFSYCTYLPSISDLFIDKSSNKLNLITYISSIDWKHIKELIFNRWFFTDFSALEIDKCDFTASADFKRYIQDQQFLEGFKHNYPLAYWIWNITTHCGWSFWRVAFWSILAILFFAGIYGIPYPLPQCYPDWLTSFLSSTVGIDPNFSMMNYSQILDKAPDLPRFWQLFYISFDIFTNLGIRTTFPMNWQGVVVMFAETVTGFVALGMMISVLTNRFARRS